MVDILSPPDSAMILVFCLSARLSVFRLVMLMFEFFENNYKKTSLLASIPGGKEVPICFKEISEISGGVKVGR